MSTENLRLVLIFQTHRQNCRHLGTTVNWQVKLELNQRAHQNVVYQINRHLLREFAGFSKTQRNNVHFSLLYTCFRHRLVDHQSMSVLHHWTVERKGKTTQCKYIVLVKGKMVLLSKQVGPLRSLLFSNCCNYKTL